jgi:hypothetical protein
LGPGGRGLLLIRSLLFGDRQLPGLAFTVAPGHLRRRPSEVHAVATGILCGWREPLISMQRSEQRACGPDGAPR